MKVAASGGQSTIDVASLRKLLARVESVRASLSRARRAAGIRAPCQAKRNINYDQPPHAPAWEDASQGHRDRDPSHADAHQDTRLQLLEQYRAARSANRSRPYGPSHQLRDTSFASHPYLLDGISELPRAPNIHHRRGWCRGPGGKHQSPAAARSIRPRHCLPRRLLARCHARLGRRGKA